MNRNVRIIKRSECKKFNVADFIAILKNMKEGAINDSDGSVTITSVRFIHIWYNTLPILPIDIDFAFKMASHEYCTKFEHTSLIND